MLLCMEFAKAKQILEEEAKPVIQDMLAPHKTEGQDDVSKELQDNPYNFVYRKKYA